MSVNSNFHPPKVIYRFDGVPADCEQFDDRVAMHRSDRYRPNSRGRTGQCTMASCHQPAALDKRVWNGQIGTWRAICLHHGRTYTKMLGATMRELVNEMLDALEKENAA